MNYYFPSPVTVLQGEKVISPEIAFNFDSGKSALKFILRSFNLPTDSEVAIPAYVCSDVKNCVVSEGLKPVLFDLKNDKTFWTEYDFNFILSRKVQVVILVHLYGFVHPDTKKIVEFCDQHNLKLIHDAAQSYGIDPAYFENSKQVIYSCGPGKSTTAAGGAWAVNIDEELYKKTIWPHAFGSLHNLKERLFFKSRQVNYNSSFFDTFLKRGLSFILKGQLKVSAMSLYQKQLASYLLKNFKRIKQTRIIHYTVLKNKISSPLALAYDDNHGQYFKLVLFCETMDSFKDYLNQHHVPFFSLFNNVDLFEAELVHFKKYACNFIEISCESSLPEAEINRISLLLLNYK